MSYRTIQKLLLPEKAEQNYGLYYGGTEGVELVEGESRSLYVPLGEKADLFTYFNGFYPGQWKQYTTLKNFRVNISLKGSCRLILGHRNGKKTVIDRSLECEKLTGENGTVSFEIQEWQEAAGCWVALEGRAEGAYLEDVSFEADMEETQRVRLAVVICTCRREQELLANLERVSRMDEESRPDIFVIDNGNTLAAEQMPDFVKLIPSRNCGGAGGFTRGILETLKDNLFTHVILMDDDIVLEPGIFEKTERFLSILKKSWMDGALAGSLIEKEIPWKQFECGARWNRGKIMAGRSGFDLREKSVLLENARKQDGEYGGWWYCCIPTRVIREKGLPLPVFIHRDDIEYGLRIGKVMSMNGIGVWHEAVTKKLPQAGEYYDIRNMAIVNSIHYEDWNVKEWKKFLIKWFGGNILRGRYEYVYLNIRAILDFLKGEAWLEQTDGVELHKRVAEHVPVLTRLEEKKDGIFYTTPDVSVYTAATKGHIVYEDSAGLCLEAKKNLWEALRLCVYMLITLRKTDRCFKRASDSYRRNWRKLTTEEFWNKYLEIGKDE